jgi:curved DNA-binding protein CbpA
VKTHYELLDVSRDAPADEIKKAFRREIARYHPDKVQHLGPEFQQIAAGRAAELTEAYRVLMDETLRAEYDEGLKGGASSSRPYTRAPSAPSPGASAAPAPEAAAQSAAGASAAPRPQADRAPSDFVRKAGMSRLRDAVNAISASATAASVPGFDAAFDIKSKSGLFKKSEPPIRLLMKFVPQVDTEAVTKSWVDAVRAAKCHDHVCVLLLLGAAGMAATKELAAAIAEQRRKTRGAVPVVVPVDVRDWEALFPPDTPAPVRAIMQWLRHGPA